MILKFPDPVTVRDLPDGFVALEFEGGEFLLTTVAVIRKYEVVEPPSPEAKYQRLLEMVKEMSLPPSMVAPPPAPPSAPPPVPWTPPPSSPPPPVHKVVRSSRNEDEVFTPYATLERCNAAVKIILTSKDDSTKNAAVNYLMGCPTYMWLESDASKLPQELREKMAQRRNFDTAGGDPNLVKYMPADLGSFVAGKSVITYDSKTPASEILTQDLMGQASGQVLQRGIKKDPDMILDPDPLAWLGLK